MEIGRGFCERGFSVGMVSVGRYSTDTPNNPTTFATKSFLRPSRTLLFFYKFKILILAEMFDIIAIWEYTQCNILWKMLH